MLPRLHRLSALTACLCIATFFTSTLAVELLGSAAAVARLKALILMPGLLILVPAIATAGATGMRLAAARGGRLVGAKRRRMPWIALNGLLVLLPCAFVLAGWSADGAFDGRFYAVQALELLAGATNLVLMGLNLRDGRRLAGRQTPRAQARAT